MIKDEISSKLRTFAKEKLSPTPAERTLVSSIYGAVCATLGNNNCLQIGSFPRYTAIRPIHDLDVLYIIGEWQPDANPAEVLAKLKVALERGFANPTKYQTEISLQSHSVTISFTENGTEKFGVDIVPSYIVGTNAYGEDKYKVPEVLRKQPSERKLYMEQIAESGNPMGWISSDPRGYIRDAREMNDLNEDFRKSVKIVKAWKSSCKKYNDKFPLKSFHLELLITEFFRDNPNAEIFDAVFDLFCNLPEFLEAPRILDKADVNRFVDQYIADLSRDEIDFVIRLRDHFLIQLENIEPETPVEDLISANERLRRSPTESYLFDQRIPILTESTLTIIGNVQERKGGFRARILDILGRIEVDRKIDFETGPAAPEADLFKWKVKNDDRSDSPRGEITDHQTLRSPEHTKYNGRHYVECFAIRNGVCIARSRQNVVLRATD